MKLSNGLLLVLLSIVILWGGKIRYQFVPISIVNALDDPYEPNDSFPQAYGPLLSDHIYNAYFPTEQDEWDFYYIELNEEDALKIDLTNIPDGSNYDLSLYDANQKLVGHSGNLGNANEQIIKLGLLPGIYYIVLHRSDGTSDLQPYHLKAVSYPQQIVYLPFVAIAPPTLNPVQNNDQDNHYTVTWQSTFANATYILEEATNASFTDAQVIYQGTNTSWIVPNPGKTPGNYYYRVKIQGTNTWSQTRQAVIYPMFVGLQLRWDGVGYIRTDDTYNVGYHREYDFNGLIDADTIRYHGSIWYDPNPQNWEATTWDSYYSVSTGYFVSSSNPSDLRWKWSYYRILPYDWQFSGGQAVYIDDAVFIVSGPHTGSTQFGQPVIYWELVNRDTFLYWDGGSAWKQYVHPGDVILRYDAGATRLLLHRDILRRYYYQNELTSYTVQYVVDLTFSNAFPSTLGTFLRPENRGQSNETHFSSDFGESLGLIEPEGAFP